MKPLAWTNTPPGTPLSLLSASSRSPRHASGSALRLSKLSGPRGTACTRHLPDSSEYTTYRGAACVAGMPCSGSSSNRCSCAVVSMQTGARTRKGKAYLPGEERLEEDDLTARIRVEARVQGLRDEAARGQPRLTVVVKAAEELAARERGRLLELALRSSKYHISAVTVDVSQRGEDKRQGQRRCSARSTPG